MKPIESTIKSAHPVMPLSSMLTSKHEKIVYHYDEPTGLQVIVAIHNTILGPALGGTRIWNYTREEDALVDVLRLSQGMTYKSAVAGLDLGGAKAVIIGDAEKIKTEGFLGRDGRFIQGLNGSYITGPDVNMTMDDLVHIAKETQYIIGLPTLQGGSGDTSLPTAYGTYLGIKAAAKKVYGQDDLKNKKVGVQGIGKVGSILIDYLCKEGAKVYITDIISDRLASVAKQHPVEVIEQADQFYALDMDIYAPCALGATINDQTIPKLRCAIIGGAANNQLADEVRHGRMLMEKNIVYVPDFVINAGGVINVHTEFYGGYNQELAAQQVERIYAISLEILTKSAQEQIPTQEVAIRLAEERIASIKQARLA